MKYLINIFLYSQFKLPVQMVLEWKNTWKTNISQYEYDLLWIWFKRKAQLLKVGLIQKYRKNAALHCTTTTY